MRNDLPGKHQRQAFWEIYLAFVTKPKRSIWINLISLRKLWNFNLMKNKKNKIIIKKINSSHNNFEIQKIRIRISVSEKKSRVICGSSRMLSCGLLIYQLKDSIFRGMSIAMELAVRFTRVREMLVPLLFCFN